MFARITNVPMPMKNPPMIEIESGRFMFCLSLEGYTSTSLAQL